MKAGASVTAVPLARVGMRVASVILLACVGLASAGCARLTPSQADSGWRPDGRVAKKRTAPERVQVLALESMAEMNEARLLLGLPPLAAADGSEAALAAGLLGKGTEIVLSAALSAWRKDIDKAAALHVARYSGISTVRPSFYVGLDEMTSEREAPLVPMLRGVLVMRQIKLGHCPADAPAAQWDGPSSQPNEYAGPWCMAMGSLHEVVHACALGSESCRHSGLFTLRPVEGGFKLYRARAKIVASRWYAPWTWWTDGAHKAWYGPWKGEKNYLDETRVQLELIPLELQRNGRRAPGQSHEWVYSRGPLEGPKGARSLKGTKQPDGTALAGESPPFNWIPLGIVPTGVARHDASSPFALEAAFGSGRGAYQIKATVTEIDSMAERLGNISKILAAQGDGAVSYAAKQLEKKSDKKQEKKQE